MQHDPDDLVPAEHLARPEGTGDGARAARRGFEAVRDTGTSIEVAASGRSRDIDLDQARLRLRDAQTALAALGYLQGPQGDASAGIDGIWGPGTQAAVQAFRSDQGLDDATQELDPEAYETLLQVYEDALGTRAGITSQDDFSPLQAEAPLADAELGDLDPNDAGDPDGSDALDLLDDTLP